MASARRWIKSAVTVWAALAVLMLMQPTSQAASFEAHRGINMDAWVTWPAESRWDDAAVILPFPEWRRTVGRQELLRLKRSGFDFVRIPIDPAPFLSPKTARLREKLYAQVLQAARAANEAGLKAIVDMHLMPSGPGRAPGMGTVMDTPAGFDAYLEVVRRMAETLAREDPAKIAFEPMNEPILDCDGDGTDLWPERQKRLWQAAREGAPKLTLVLSGACYAGAEALAKVERAEIPDANVIWTFHSYNPFVLTHQGATWAGDFIPYVTGLPFPLHALSKKDLEARVDRIRARIEAEAPWARRTALLALLDELVTQVDTPEKLAEVMNEPFAIVAGWAARNKVKPQDILLGEFGMIRQEYGGSYTMPAADRAAYVKAMAGAAERHGYPWSVWSYGGAFGIVDAFDGERAEPDVLEAVKALPPYPDFTLRLATD